MKSTFAIALLATLAVAACFGSGAEASASGCYSGTCGSASAKSGFQRYVQEEHHDVRILAVSGVFLALGGLLVAMGWASKTYFQLLAQNGGICSLTTLVAWVFSIWAVITAVFVGVALIIAFSI